MGATSPVSLIPFSWYRQHKSASQKSGMATTLNYLSNASGVMMIAPTWSNSFPDLAVYSLRWQYEVIRHRHSSSAHNHQIHKPACD